MTRLLFTAPYGKTTISQQLQKEILERNINCEILDVDIVRQNLCKGLGYSKEDRCTNNYNSLQKL